MGRLWCCTVEQQRFDTSWGSHEGSRKQNICSVEYGERGDVAILMSIKRCEAALCLTLLQVPQVPSKTRNRTAKDRTLMLKVKIQLPYLLVSISKIAGSRYQMQQY
jgi:hypothetical protein